MESLKEIVIQRSSPLPTFLILFKNILFNNSLHLHALFCNDMTEKYGFLVLIP